MTPPGAKRAFDLAVAIPALLIALPIVAVSAVFIKLDSPGRIFYRGPRVGLGGREFQMWKLRTMREDADAAGPSVTGARDQRVTPIGRRLRRTKIDELPQLLNVLAGQMSIVGPRPEHPRYVRLYTPAQERVLEVRPGMTSLASLRFADEEDVLSTGDPEGTYLETVMPAKLAIDLEYVDNQSLWQDISIVLRTAGLVLSRSLPPRGQATTHMQ